MSKLSFLELSCFDAVATEGGFERAAAKLNRTHPSVYAAVKRLEERLDLCLLDRSGYRVSLTEAGTAFHHRARALLDDVQGLERYADQLAVGEETELTVVIGDLCPVPAVLGLLRQFFDRCPSTRLHIHFEALSGPWEWLFDEKADLVIHHLDESDMRVERVELFTVHLVPVAAPGLVSFPVSSKITSRQMREYPQCIIRDSARHSPPQDYFLLDGAHSWTVADQLMKKQLILQSMGWGHMPTFLVEEELRSGKLVSLLGEYFPGTTANVAMIRLRNRPVGLVADRLWKFVEKEAKSTAMKRMGGPKRNSRWNSRRS